jgi:hypothetical protein
VAAPATSVDYGVELNARIRVARERVLRAAEALERAERAFDDVVGERRRAIADECGGCDDCSLCLG